MNKTDQLLRTVVLTDYKESLRDINDLIHTYFFSSFWTLQKVLTLYDIAALNCTQMMNFFKNIFSVIIPNNNNFICVGKKVQ